MYANEVLKMGDYSYVVILCQEVIELALKAALRLVGIKAPKWHDVGPILRHERSRFPKWFQELVDELVSISRSLRKEGELAMYGNEEVGISLKELYVRRDAEEALKQANEVVESVEKLMNELITRS